MSFIVAQQNKNQCGISLLIEIDREGDTSDDDDVIFVANFPSNNAVESNTTEIDTVDNLTNQTLRIIANEYINQIGATNTDIVVRPWMTDVECARKPYINTISQFALYKCMLDKCVYATNTKDSFEIHIKMHDQVIDYFEKENFFDNNQTRDKLNKFRECAYCNYKSKANHQLIEHMEKMHRRCIFQCSNCFYRTIEVDNILLHQKTYHPTGENAILLCGEKREFHQQDEDILGKADQNVMKIRCGQGK